MAHIHLREVGHVDLVEMSDDLPKEVDERFAGLILDQFAPRQLFVGEGEGARYFIDLLSPIIQARSPECRFHLIYADTSPSERCYATSLRALPLKHVHIFPTKLIVVQRLPSLLTQLGGFDRAYIAGASWFVEVADVLLTRAGLERTHIMFELCKPFSRKVTCSFCGASTIADGDSAICCGCQAALAVTSYFSVLSNSFLGVLSGD